MIRSIGRATGSTRFEQLHLSPEQRVTLELTQTGHVLQHDYFFVQPRRVAGNAG